MFARAHVFEERDLSTCDAQLSFFPIILDGYPLHSPNPNRLWFETPARIWNRRELTGRRRCPFGRNLLGINKKRQNRFLLVKVDAMERAVRNPPDLEPKYRQDL